MNLRDAHTQFQSGKFTRAKIISYRYCCPRYLSAAKLAVLGNHHCYFHWENRKISGKTVQKRVQRKAQHLCISMSPVYGASKHDTPNIIHISRQWMIYGAISAFYQTDSGCRAPGHPLTVRRAAEIAPLARGCELLPPLCNCKLAEPRIGLTKSVLLGAWSRENCIV